MRTSEIHIISKVIKNEYFYLSDPVRLIIPKLLMYATNELDFFTLLELSKRDSIRNLILKSIPTVSFKDSYAFKCIYICPLSSEEPLA